MKLYFAPGACSLSPHIVLREAGRTFDLESVDLKAKKLKNGADYYQVNPKGQPSCNTSPTWPRHRDLSRPQAAKSVTAPRNGSISSPQNCTRTSALVPSEHPRRLKPIAKDNLANRFAYVDKHLSNRPYLVGDKFTVADAYLFTILNWAKFQSIDLAPWPNLLKFMARVGERPNVKEALRAEGLA